jgi:hypothetical protein
MVNAGINLAQLNSAELGVFQSCIMSRLLNSQLFPDPDVPYFLANYPGHFFLAKVHIQKCFFEGEWAMADMPYIRSPLRFLS